MYTLLIFPPARGILQMSILLIRVGNRRPLRSSEAEHEDEDPLLLLWPSPPAPGIQRYTASQRGCST